MGDVETLLFGDIAIVNTGLGFGLGFGLDFGLSIFITEINFFTEILFFSFSQGLVRSREKNIDRFGKTAVTSLIKCLVSISTSSH